MHFGIESAFSATIEEGFQAFSATGGLLFKRRPGLLSVPANLPLRSQIILIRRPSPVYPF